MLPQINQQVELARAGESLKCGVLFIGETYIAVSRPLNARPEYAPENDEYLLSWASKNGLISVPVHVHERLGRGGDQLIWEAKPIGEYIRNQRRKVVRIEVDRPMRIVDLSSEEAEPVPAHLVDISELALRLSITDLSWLQVPDGTRTGVYFTVTKGGEEFAAEGYVMSTRAGTEKGKIIAQVVVHFHASPDWTSKLRAAIFAEQRRIAEVRRQNQTLREGLGRRQ